MSQPEKINLKELIDRERRDQMSQKNLPPVPKPAEAGGGIIDPDPTNIIPLFEEYDRISVPRESQSRTELLAAVTVDEKGVAHCKNRGTQTLLAAVLVVDQNASIVPFVVDDESKELQLRLPADRPSKIGFFIGSQGGEMSAVLRQGDYPGIPFITQAYSVNSKKVTEIRLGMIGIKERELDEKKWAEQVGLFTELGFAPERSRGIFAKSHQKNSVSPWEDQPLVVLPDELRELVGHYDAYEVTKDLMQVLTYGLREQQSLQQPKPWGNSPYMMGGDIMKSAVRGGVGIGYGYSYQTDAQTTNDGKVPGQLAGAFAVRIVAAAA